MAAVSRGTCYVACQPNSAVCTPFRIIFKNALCKTAVTHSKPHAIRAQWVCSEAENRAIQKRSSYQSIQIKNEHELHFAGEYLSTQSFVNPCWNTISTGTWCSRWHCGPTSPKRDEDHRAIVVKTHLRPIMPKSAKQVKIISGNNKKIIPRARPNSAVLLLLLIALV